MEDRQREQFAVDFDLCPRDNPCAQSVIALGWIIVVVFVLSMVVAKAADAQTDLPDGKQKATVGDDRDGIVSFLKHYCVRCHGDKKQDGDLAIHKLGTEKVRSADVEIWKKVFNKLASGEMPPNDAKQPLQNQRTQTLLLIQRMLSSVGATLDDNKWRHPSRGNWVNHDLLFSGKSITRTATRGRLWRLTGQAYEEFIQSLNLKYRLGFRTYGHHRVRSPWELSPNEGFRDYASQHRIGEPEIEHHLRNATRVARAMVARLPKNKSEETQALKSLLATGKSSTSEQIKTAAGAAFTGILGRQPT
jgi:hypothetical protein